MVEPYKPLYTAKQAAQILLINVSTVYELMNTGQLPYLILGKGNGTRKIRGSDLERFIETQKPAEPQGEAENVHALLIMNYQKNKPIADREPVHEKQVALAVRNGSLIIDTYMLLKLFEKFKRNEISSEDCRNILKSKVGILKSI